MKRHWRASWMLLIGLMGPAAVASQQADTDADESFTNKFGMQFVRIQPGSFMMGTSVSCPPDDRNTPANEYEDCVDALNANRDELPLHEVTLSREFYIGRHEVTQQQWTTVMGTNPSAFNAARLGIDTAQFPVENVSWIEVQEFVSRLNTLDPTSTYRLPSEAEWEYACRSGTTGDFAGKLGLIAWYDLTSGHHTHAVGTKQPNAWGLFDVHGNVWEWCQDWYDKRYYNVTPKIDPHGADTGSRRVIRGGGIYDSAEQCRAAYRGSGLPDDRSNGLGFRLVRIPK